jgi:hypothetical protein
MKFIVAIVGVFLLALTATAQTNCEQLKEDFGGFSICIPSGWKIGNHPGEVYRIAFGPLENGFSPNINFKSHGVDLTLAEYVSLNVDAILTSADSLGFSNVRLKTRTRFVTNAKSVGFKVVLLSELQGFKLRTVQYFFAGKDGEKLVMTGTTLEDRGAALELVFDRAARSLKQFEIIITPHS